MEKEGKSNQRGCRVQDTDFLLQWGKRKRLRCVKVKNDVDNKSDDCLVRKKITSRIDRRVVAEAPSPLPHRSIRDSPMSRMRGKSTSCSPDKEDRYYTTRGSLGFDDNGKVYMDSGRREDKVAVWPKLFLSLSSKEKEDDFMLMKGCKPPQRPKKRAKLLQRTLLSVSPGAWLSDLCQERYEVREKKASKKKPRGLKGMGSVESDSE